MYDTILTYKIYTVWILIYCSLNWCANRQKWLGNERIALETIHTSNEESFNKDGKNEKKSLVNLFKNQQFSTYGTIDLRPLLRVSVLPFGGFRQGSRSIKVAEPLFCPWFAKGQLPIVPPRLAVILIAVLAPLYFAVVARIHIVPDFLEPLGAAYLFQLGSFHVLKTNQLHCHSLTSLWLLSWLESCHSPQ